MAVCGGAVDAQVAQPRALARRPPHRRHCAHACMHARTVSMGQKGILNLLPNFVTMERSYILASMSRACSSRMRAGQQGHVVCRAPEQASCAARRQDMVRG